MTVPHGSRTRIPPLVALGVAVGAVSTSAILVRWSATPTSVKAFYRVGFTVLLLGPIAVRDRAVLDRLGKRDLFFASAAGLALAAHFALWFESLRFTSVAASVTLVQSQPVFVVIGAAVFLDERVDIRTTAGVIVALVGMLTMSAGDLFATSTVGAAPIIGDALAVLGAVAAAAYVLAGRSLRQRVPHIPYVTVVYAVCAIGLGGLVLVKGDPFTGYPPREWVLFLAMAIAQGCSAIQSSIGPSLTSNRPS